MIYEYLQPVDARYSLDNLANDPSETSNLAAKNPNQLRALMRGMVHELELRGAVYLVRDGHPQKPIVP